MHAETGISRPEHRPEQHPVVFPPILDLESDRGEKIEALLQIVDGKAGTDIRASATASEVDA